MSHYDLLALGEVMLRLDPGENRIAHAQQFTVWEGGGEYNVARALSKCFGLSTGLISALADNDIGRLIENRIHQGKVDTQFVKWVSYDGLGHRVRNGLNFTERGFGLRGARGCVDRGHSAAAQLKMGDFDFDRIFSENKIRWLHAGGIFAALSAETFSLTSKACRSAHEHGIQVSYDLNYRPSLWQEKGGFAAAQKLNRQILSHVDVAFGALTEKPIAASTTDRRDPEDIFASEATLLRQALANMRAEFPNLKVAAATLRRVHSASRNDWGGVALMGDSYYRSRNYSDLAVLDRIGAGDSFAAGLIYGLLTDKTPQLAVDIAAAHGALTMTTPGDASVATLDEVLALAQSADAHIIR